MIRLSRSAGFSLIELMIAVAIMAILSSLAIESLYTRFQMRAKSAEALVNLSNMQKCQDSYRAENDTYTSCPKNPAAWTPATGSTPIDWDVGIQEWDQIGFAPDGRVRYQYIITSAATVFTAQASGNLDSDADVCVFTISNDGVNHPNEAAIYPKPTRVPDGEY